MNRMTTRVVGCTMGPFFYCNWFKPDYTYIFFTKSGKQLRVLFRAQFNLGQPNF